MSMKPQPHISYFINEMQEHILDKQLVNLES
jgi:hypothetical protein